MEFKNNRVQDITQVFDKTWNVNHNNRERQEFLESRAKHFKKMYNIRDKEEQKKEVLGFNSVEKQVERLNERIQAMTSCQNKLRMNDLKNNFR